VSGTAGKVDFPRGLPVPAISRDTLAWWEAAAQHRLVVQTCSACGKKRHPPGPTCPACRSFAHEWIPSSGRGAVYTYTVVRQAFMPALAGGVPYVVAIVELEDAAVRLFSNVVGIDPEEVRIGMPVEVVWDDVAPGVAVPRFRPRADAAHDHRSRT
jgi:uncharacterized OB-fold protein